MNSKLKVLAAVAALTLSAALCGCTPADGNESGKENVTPPPSAIESVLAKRAEGIVGETAKGATQIPDGSSPVTGKITIESAGNYYVNTNIEGKKITVNSEGVTLFLSNATLSNEKKVIESAYPLTITLLGESTISNDNIDGSNAIDCAGGLVINGNGKLTINSTKNGIKANSISVIGAKLDITSVNDGLHAEVEAYDTLTSAPAPSYTDGGYVYLNQADVKVNAGADGIQADTFVYISDSVTDIKAGGGAPETLSAEAQTNGKGIKAGPIDWGTDKTDVDWDEHLIHIAGGKLDVNSDGSAIDSNGETNVENCTVKIATGKTAVKASKNLNLLKATIQITKSLTEYKADKINNLDK